MGNGGPEGQRADEHAERRAAPSPEPGGHELERGWIDAGEEEAGGEAERDRGAGAGDGSEERVRPGCPQRAGEHDRPRGDDVGDVEDARDERAGDEAELDGDGQPRGGGVRQPPVGAELRDDRGGREPRGHGQDERRGQDPQRAAAAGR